MKHFTKLFVGLLLACAAIAAPLQAQAQTIAWDPWDLFFGSVPIGTTESRTLTLSNSDAVVPLNIDSIEFGYNDRGAWSLETSEPVPAVLPPGGTLDVIISFTPSEWSFFMGDIRIENNSTNASPLFYSFMGEGTEGDPCAPLALCGDLCVDTQVDVDHCGWCWNACVAPENGAATCEAGGCGFVCDEGYEPVGDGCELIVVENDPLAMIGDIIDFFDASRADGTLVGLGPGRSGEHRADALGNMLDEAEALIAAEEWDEACGQLQSAYLRTDNSFPPPDFVAGENTYALAEMLWNLGVEMDCPMTQVSCSAAPGSPAAPSLLLFGLLGLALARLRRR